MTNPNGNQFSFLTPHRTASSGGVRVFDVGDSLPLSAHDKEKLSAVLAKIVEQYPAHISREVEAPKELSAEAEASGSSNQDDDRTSP